MPLLDGKPFYRQPPPADLDPNEPVFFSSITLEVFRNYEAYFDRTVQINSLIWNCQICGRGEMTFADAASCERNDLTAFNPALTTGLLYIIHNSKRQRLGELVELLSSFTTHRYFIGEPIWYCESSCKKQTPATVRRVFWAASTRDACFGHQKTLSVGHSESFDHLDELSIESENGKLPSPVELLYHVVDDKSSMEAPSNRQHSRPRTILSCSQLERRGRDSLTRDSIKLFIRNTCELKNGFFSPKSCIMRRFSLSPYGPVTWADLFILPEPKWNEVVERLLSVLQPNRRSSFSSTLSPLVHPSSRHLTAFSSQSISNSDTDSLCRTTDDDTMFAYAKNLSADFSRHRKHMQLVDQPIFDRGVNAGPHVRKQTLGSRYCGFATTTKSASSTPSRLHGSLNLEHRERMELEREWGAVRPREDLELSDLVPLPEFPEFESRIPSEDLGLAIQLFEFFNVFGSHLNLFFPNETLPDRRWNRRISEVEKDSTTSSNISWSTLVNGLTDSDPSGPLADFFISLLCAIRKLDVDASIKQMGPSVLAATYAAAAAAAAAEVGVSFASFTIGHASDYGDVYDELTSGEDGKEILRVLGEAGAATRFNELVGIPGLASNQAAGKAGMVIRNIEDPSTDSNASKEEQQAPVTLSRNVTARAATMATLAGAASLCPLDRAGLSKALWLHIKSSPARISSWRGQTRGAMRPLDDPAFIFARDSPDLLEKLNTVSVYELTVHEKLILLTCLMDQLLLYSHMRDYFDHNFNRLRSLRNQSRSVDGTEGTDAIQNNGTLKMGMEQPSNVKSEQLTDGGNNNQVLSAPEDSKTLHLSQVYRRDAASSVPDIDCKSSQVPIANPSSGATGAMSANLSCLNLVSPDADLLQSVKTLRAMLETSRGCCLLPLGQDRFYRYYWFVPSLASILIEDTSLPFEQDTQQLKIVNCQLSSYYPELAERLGICSFIQAAQRLRRYVQKWSVGDLPVPDREKLTYRLACKLPEGVVLTLDQLRMLVKPPPVSAHTKLDSGPAAVQCSKILSARQDNKNCNYSRWFTVCLLPELPQEPSDIKNCSPPASSSPPGQNQLKSDSAVDSSDSKGAEVNLEKCDCQTTEVSPRCTSEQATKAHDSVPESPRPLNTPISWDQAVWTIDCLEASLNPRGLREARLRKTIGELRPLLIRLVAEQNSNRFTDVNTKTEPFPDCAPAQVQLSWLEIALRRLAARLRLRKYVASLFTPEPIFEERQSNKTSAYACSGAQSANIHSSSSSPNHGETIMHVGNDSSVLMTNNLEPGVRLMKLTQILLALGNAIGPKAVSGPISQESRTLRTSRLLLSLGESTLPNDPLTLEASYGQSPLRTTGWQRWCTHVEQATSSSELHLLARALERGVRRAALGGRRIPFAAFSKKCSIPKIRCTACRWPPDPPSTNSQPISHPLVHSIHHGPYIPLSTCSGCSAPFHLDCLLNSRSRIHRSSLRSQSNKSNPPCPTTLKGLTKSDLSMTGYCGLHSPLNSTTAARMETCCASLYLCNACLRAAGKQPQCDLVADQVNYCSVDQLTGDEEWESQSEHSASEGDDSEILRETERPTKVSCKVPPIIDGPRRRGRPAKLRSPEHANLCAQSRRRYSAPTGNPKPLRSTRLALDVSRPLNAKHQRSRRVLKRLQSNHRLTRSFSNTVKRSLLSTNEETCSTRTERSRRASSRYSEYGIVRPLLSAPSDVTSIRTFTDGERTDNEATFSLDEKSMLRFPDMFLKKATVVIAPCDIVHDSSVTSHSSQGSKHHFSKPDPIIHNLNGIAEHAAVSTGSLRQNDNQKWVEKLFAELCHSNSARPLLRCGLGRQLAWTDQKGRRSSEPAIPHRQSTRNKSLNHQASPAGACEMKKSSEKLLAWDLSALQDLLIRKKLPGGPEQAIVQLRLLISHWVNSNRPGSRLHQCALDLSRQLEAKLNGSEQQAQLSSDSEARLKSGLI